MKLVLVKTSKTGRFVRCVPNEEKPSLGSGASRCSLCWHCCHAFDGEAIPLPLTYDTHLDAYKVYGYFCSFPCMFGYLRDNRLTLPGASHGSIGMTAFQFFRQCTGHADPRRIDRAPPRCMLKAFGGTMTLDEFRGPSSVTYDRLPPKCILHEQVYHERLNSTSHRHVRSVVSEPTASGRTVPGETLRLKRKYQNTEPPRPTTKKTILEQTLGIA